MMIQHDAIQYNIVQFMKSKFIMQESIKGNKLSNVIPMKDVQAHL